MARPFKKKLFLRLPQVDRRTKTLPIDMFWLKGINNNGRRDGNRIRLETKEGREEG